MLHATVQYIMLTECTKLRCSRMFPTDWIPCSTATDMKSILIASYQRAQINTSYSPPWSTQSRGRCREWFQSLSTSRYRARFKPKLDVRVDQYPIWIVRWGLDGLQARRAVRTWGTVKDCNVHALLVDLRWGDTFIVSYIPPLGIFRLFLSSPATLQPPTTANSDNVRTV